MTRPRRAFHANVRWAARQVPMPEGRGKDPLPQGLSYLWLTELWGTATGTHLGVGGFEGSICLYGRLTRPEATPPGNGVPLGWQDGRIVLVAADGDRLVAKVRSTGATAPPGAPDFQFIEEVSFTDGGTGRFRCAEGEAVGYVDPVKQTAVYDGWIRYGKEGG